MPLKTTTREQILDATWKLFNERSPNTPTVAEVAKAAGVSRQAVYLHFENRAKLLTETLRKQQSETQERLKDAREVKPDLVFANWVGTMFDEYERILPVGRALAATAPLDPDGAVVWEDRNAALRRTVGYVVERFDSLGMLKPGWSVETAIDWVFSRINFSTWQLMVHDCGWSQAQAIERTTESLESDLLTLSRPD